MKARLDDPTSASTAVFASCFIAAKDEIKVFGVYDMQGDQGATTEITLDDGTKTSFKTTAQKHSEMCAIEHLIGDNYVTLKPEAGKVSATGTEGIYSLSAETFTTAQPHCGYCSIILQLLGFPLTKPTQGRFNEAVNLAYPIPERLKKADMILAMLFRGDTDKFATFLGETFANDGVTVTVDVTGNKITIGGQPAEKLDKFLAK